MELILANFDSTLSTSVDVFFQLLKVVKAKVGHANGTGFTGSLGFCQSTPGTETTLLSTEWRMKKDPAPVSSLIRD
jgi:hypothetical protein